MDHTYSAGIGSQPQFRAQLSEEEHTTWRRKLHKFISDMQLQVSQDTDEEGIIWYSSDDNATITHISDWHVGYCMALGFDEDGVRHR